MRRGWVLVLAGTLTGCGASTGPALPGSLLWVDDATAEQPDVRGVRGNRPLPVLGLEGAAFPGPVDPAGTHVALIEVHEEAEGHRERLWLAELATASVVPLSEVAGRVRNPVWSSDGSWLVFESDRHSFRDLYRVSRFGQGLVRLTEASGGAFEPDVSAQGEVLYGTSRDGNAEVYRMDPDSGKARRLTAYPGDDVRPRWSPDGQQIAWLSSRRGAPEVHLMAEDGSAVHPLRTSGQGHVDRDVRWSPDGQRLAVVTQVGADRVDLTVVSVGGQVLWTAEAAPVQEHPEWSPDGQWLAWTATTEGRSEVWVADRDGQSAARIAEAAWLPRWGA